MAEELASTSTSQQSSTPESSTDAGKKSQVPAFSGFPALPNGDFQMFPVMYPVVIPGTSSFQDQELANRGAGIYAVPTVPFMGHVSGLPSNTLIPLTYSIPTRAASESGGTGDEHGQVAGQQQRQQQVGPQRQVVVRRFQIAFQLDLLLIMKLAAVIFLFNQEGSRQRLAVLVFFASLIYLYQTGALTPLIRWLSQGMQRAAAPPQPPRPAVRADNNVPAAERQGNENVPLADGAENENRPGESNNQAGGNGNIGEPPAQRNAAGNQWWGFAREIQMIVFGFITSLLPGFHNLD